ncbi:hypothetical protein HN924_02475 [Candidatus Woesearchaeota archaeon]|jgi:hypothetical protein|nr:hypothetical protein [Candidatus Woesearchaeota archaeon]MBT7062810.1 hypothetical protein [Candidatus Woesearchaeota archaeon]MBT7403028.1 hypothetical protein [Candidatus Woesearchaeota archaeon]
MVQRPKFEDQLSVIRVRKNYAAPYLKQKYVYIDKKDVKTERTFKQAMNDRIRNWPDGIYFLKLSSGKVFTRFNVHEGKVGQIFKISPATGMKYPMHEFFTKR